ncbi:AAA family ATPase [Vampirovibrio chlorellavorus]|uniref:AAA family ATPase n=1 Tax=Vampirovibrio chlorellavorus TaxID=758823 RepID=UPI0026EB6E38|nr:AAA family ATPase [Vampirovibrio chlorellavorus]
MNSIKVVAVASSEETRLSLYNQLQALDFIDFNGVYIELSDAVRECQEVGPDVILVDLTARELDAGLFIQAIGMNPETPCVIFALHREMDLTVFKESIRQGAKEFIQYPEDKPGLEVALKKHFNYLSRLSSQNQKNHASAKDSKEIPANGKIIACFASKGGVGCSTVAVNLAHELHALKHLSVAFVDLDQVFCNSAIMLNHKPSYSLGDIAENDPKDVDESLLNKIIVKHESGLHVVVGSKSVLDDNEMISAELLEKALDYLTLKHHFVIIDLPTHVLDPYHQYVVERADEILVISASDIPSLYRTRQYLDLAQKYLDMRKVKMVLNRYNLKAAYRMSNQDVESEFRYEIFARLPNDWELNVEANSFGSSLSKVNPKSELVKALQKLALQLTGESPAVEQNSKPANGQGLLGKLFTAKTEPNQPKRI